MFANSRPIAVAVPCKMCTTVSQFTIRRYAGRTYLQIHECYQDPIKICIRSFESVHSEDHNRPGSNHATLTCAE